MNATWRRLAVGSDRARTRIKTAIDKREIILDPISNPGDLREVRTSREGMTVKAVASRIARAPEDVSRIIEQLRHWTRIGLLKPEGGVLTSTGHWRRYSEREMHIAAVPAALSRMGWTVGPLRDAVAMLRDQLILPGRSNGGDAWRDAIEGRRRVLAFFSIAIKSNGKGYGTCVIDPGRPSVPENWPAGVWLDPTAIFANVRQ